MPYRPNRVYIFHLYTYIQVLYTPTSFLQEVYMKFMHLLLNTLIGQNVQATVQYNIAYTQYIAYI